MTVQTSTNVAAFVGNGVTTSFPIGFKFNSSADLIVEATNTVTGVTTPLSLNSDYTVTGAGDENGGTITFTAAPLSVEKVKVTRHVDLLQLTDLRNQGKFYAEVHEDVFDKLVMIDQQQQTEINTANDKSDEALEVANAANGKSDQAVAKADQNLVDMQAQYDAFEQGASLVVIGDYAAGLVVDGYNKVFRKDGEFYRAKAELTLPYPLNGDWAVDAPKFVSVGDAVLRQELAGADGVYMVGGARRTVASLAALSSINVRQSGDVVCVEHRTQPLWAEAAPLVGGGGDFVWVGGDQSAQVAADPGQGVWLAPDADVTGASGAWRRLYDGPLRAEWWGVADTGADITSQAQAFVTYCNAKKLSGAFPAGTLRISGSLEFPNEIELYGQGQATVFSASLPAGAYLFDQPTTYCRSYALGRFRVNNAVSAVRRDFGVIRLWGTLRKGLVEDIVSYDLVAPYFFDTNQWGQVSLKRLCAYNFNGSNVVLGSNALEFKGNTMFAEDIEILGTFDRGLVFSGRVFKLHGFNIGGSENDYMRIGVRINGGGDGCISSGWIEQLDPVYWGNGAGLAIDVDGAKNVEVRGVDVAAGSVFYKNGATGSVSSVTYGQANGGLRVESGSVVAVSSSALKYQAMTDSPAFPRLLDGNHTGAGLNATPTFVGADPMTNTNNTYVTVADNTTDFLTGTRSRLVTTTETFQGRRFTATIPKAEETYTVVARVRRLTSGRLSMTPEATTVIDASGFTIYRTSGTDWELLIMTVRSSTTSLQVRIIAETAGTFLIDSFNVLRGLSTFDPKNYA
jgi:hypothetical protein